VDSILSSAALGSNDSIQPLSALHVQNSRAKRWVRGAKNIGEAVFATTCREHSAQRHCMPQLNPQINLAAEPYSL